MQHQLNHFSKGGVFSHGNHRMPHDLPHALTAYSAGDLFNVLGRRCSTQERVDILRLMAVSGMQPKISVGENPHEVFLLIHDWQAADRSLQHYLRRFSNRGVGCYGKDRGGHQIPC
jgi:hypothetical protein